MNAFVKEILAKEKNADVIALGDINDFEFSDTAELLENNGVLWSAIKSLPKSERYSYVFQGNAQVLDQILVSPLDPALHRVHVRQRARQLGVQRPDQRPRPAGGAVRAVS